MSGNMQLNQWTAQDGATASGYQVVADSVISARTVKPAGRKGQQGQAGAALRRAQESQASQESYPRQYDQTPPFGDDF